MTMYSLTLQNKHAEKLKAHLIREDGKERAAYLLCGKAKIKSDPWERKSHQKFLSYDVIPVLDEDVIVSTQTAIEWKTNSFVQLLKQAQKLGLHVAVVHNHGANFPHFSECDDHNEPGLIELAQHRNGPETPLISLLLMPAGQVVGRIWLNTKTQQQIDLIRIFGNQFQLNYPGRGNGMTSELFQRQILALGKPFTQDLSRLRVGIVGCGGTGSAMAMLLARLGIGQILLIDKDIIEKTNLNRVHGARQSDVDAMLPKVDVVARSITELGIGVRVVKIQAWVNEAVSHDAIKSCDIVFGCTDDNQGRIFLNRLAYYYLIPVFDMGLAIELTNDDSPKIQAMDGRVTVLYPGTTCLLCREIIDPRLAQSESLQRSNPEEFERQKNERYVIGGGNQAPAVVTFTTETALMAVNELVHRLHGYREGSGSTDSRTRFFHRMTDIRPGESPAPYCPVCFKRSIWGKGDVDPFLGVIL